MTRTLTLTAASLLALAACVEPAAGPTLDEVDYSADDQVQLIDRAAALQGAQDYMDAPIGDAFNPAEAPPAFFMEVDTDPVEEPDSTAPPAGSYGNVIAARLMVAVAAGVTYAVVAPPAIAINVAANGEITQIDDNLWQATNSVVIDEVTYDLELNIAYVIVGHLAEMKVSSDDGRYEDTVWFTGFVSYGGNLGWWDLYDGSGELQGVIEWIHDGDDSGEFGIASTAGENAGDVLAWWRHEGAAAVTYHDDSTEEDAYVYVAPDLSGELRHPDYNLGDPACWDVDFLDASCDDPETSDTGE